MGRRSIWSDERVIALAARFVPAADEVWRLQNDDDPECRFFRRMVRGTDKPSPGTMQGTYVFAPGGQLLGRINSYSADATRKVMERALAKWKELPAEAKQLADPKVVQPQFRWEDSYPKDGLVLIRTARDLPRDHDPKAKKSVPYNRDAVWFSKAEARQWLPERLEVGAIGMGSRVIGSRLAQFVLVDNARGQTIPYHDKEVRDATVKTEIASIDGDLVKISIAVETRSAAKGPWLFGDNYWKPGHESPHSIATWTIGNATFDNKADHFVAFEAVGLGYHTGHTANNGRGGEAKSGPIGFVLRLAPKTWRVAPTFINVYNADWVKRPK